MYINYVVCVYVFCMHNSVHNGVASVTCANGFFGVVAHNARGMQCTPNTPQCLLLLYRNVTLRNFSDHKNDDASTRVPSCIHIYFVFCVCCVFEGVFYTDDDKRVRHVLQGGERLHIYLSCYAHGRIQKT